MNDCEFRKVGEDFCEDCPLRPVRKECRREGFCIRANAAIPASPQTRVGVFLLSALSITLIPVVSRSLYKIAEEHVIPDPLVWLLTVAAIVAGMVTLTAALCGIYSSVFSRNRA
jgi:hypothetical protein